MKSRGTITGILFLFVVTGCKNYFFNRGLEKIGVYDTKIRLEKFKNDDKMLVLFPMKHIATEEFYTDTKNKIDSLKSLGYYFFFEMINVAESDTTILRKFRKIHGIPIAKPGQGYMSLIDSLYKFKLKKKIIDQPNYEKLGIDKSIGRRVDLDLKDIIKTYESKYGEIRLEKCDYETTYYEKTNCVDKKIDDKIINSLILTLRNEKIINEVLLDKRKKIGIIYGQEHFVEIKQELLKHGYK